MLLQADSLSQAARHEYNNRNYESALRKWEKAEELYINVEDQVNALRVMVYQAGIWYNL